MHVQLDSRRAFTIRDHDTQTTPRTSIGSVVHDAKQWMHFGGLPASLGMITFDIARSRSLSPSLYLLVQVDALLFHMYCPSLLSLVCGLREVISATARQKMKKEQRYGGG